MVGQLKGTGTGFLNHHVKKGNMVLMMDLVQNLFPSTASFGASFCSINIDVVVMINDCHHFTSVSRGPTSQS